MKSKLKGILVRLAFVAVLAMALISFAAWSCSSPAVDLGDLNRIRVGMTQSQVAEILGQPDEEYSTEGVAGSHWRYENPLKWYALRIDFTEDGRVIRYVHDD